MPVTLAIVLDEDHLEDHEDYVILDEELQLYLKALEGYPSIKVLGEVDPFAVTKIKKEIRLRLNIEIDKLLIRVKEKSISKPPEYVGMEGPNDPYFGEKFGWEGLMNFLQKLKLIVQKDKSLFAIGD